MRGDRFDLGHPMLTRLYCGYLFFWGKIIHPSQNVNVSCKMKFIILVESST
jgi:hypothetical protein